MRRIAVAVALVATLLVGVRALTPDHLTAATAEAPELRSRPSDAELADGYRHLVVHSDTGAPQGVETTPMGGGDYQVKTKLDDEQVAALPGVAAVSHDVWADPYAADPDLGSAWGLENDGRVAGGWPGVVDADIDATSAWDRTRGEGVVVAVIDEGVDRRHPELSGRMWRNADEVCGNAVDDDRNGYVDDCDGWDFARNDNTTFDLDADSTHGTHIAGTIAAESDNGAGFAGVAPRATIMPLKVGDSGSFSLSAAAAAVNYAVDNGAKVINASWGTSGVTRAQLPWLEAAVERARQAGVLIVAAAGNDGRDIDASPSFPASFPEDNVITVGASTNADAAAYFSNYGATSVDLFAPGWFIWSTLPGGTYGTMSGTSMAAPHVAGAAALAIAADPSATVATIKGNLLATVDRKPAFAGRSVSGGRLNAAAAVGESDQPVSFHFDGFAGLTDGVAGQWTVTAEADDVLEPARLELGLVTQESGDVYGVSGLPISVDGASLTTDDGGWFRTAVGSGVTSGGQGFTIGAALPAGEYVLVARLVDDGGTPVAPAQALWFAVGGATADVPEVPVTPPVSEPPPVEQTPGGGYTPAPRPDGGQPVPTPSPSPAPCSNCGQPAPTTPVFVPPPASTPTSPSSPSSPPTTTAAATTTTVRPSSSPSTTTTTAAPSTPTTVRSTTTTSTTARPSTTTSTTARPVTTTSTTVRPTTTTTAAPSSPAPSNPSPSNPSTTVASVSPTSGARTGGSTVVVGGSGFTSSSVVRFGGSVAQVSVAWPTMLLVRTPAHAPGAVDVTVTNGSTTVILPGAYTYAADSSSPSTPSAPSSPSSPSPPSSPSTTVVTTTTTTVRPTTTTTAAAPAPSTTSTTSAPTTTTTAHVAGPLEVRGLHLKPLAQGHPLATIAASTWPSRRCTSGSCAGSPLA